MLTEMKDGEPGWIASLDNSLARGLAGQGTVVAISLTVLCTAAVLTIAGPPRLTRIGVIAAALAGLVIWVVQDFGEISPVRAPTPIQARCSSSSPPHSGPSSPRGASS